MLYNQRSTGLSHVLQPLRNRYVASTGIRVKANSIDPNSAKHTVYAIGVNKRRSTRSSVNSGMYAEMMISSEKKIGDSTSSAAFRMVSYTVPGFFECSR